MVRKTWKRSPVRKVKGTVKISPKQQSRRKMWEEIEAKETQELPGYCYRNAFYKARAVKGKVVHGSIYSQVLRKYFKHAWVEKGNIVYESSTVPSTNFSKKEFYAMTDAKVDNIYSIKEAGILLIRTHAYGPWTREEIELGLKRC